MSEQTQSTPKQSAMTAKEAARRYSEASRAAEEARLAAEAAQLVARQRREEGIARYEAGFLEAIPERKRKAASDLKKAEANFEEAVLKTGLVAPAYAALLDARAKAYTLEAEHARIRDRQRSKAEASTLRTSRPDPRLDQEVERILREYTRARLSDHRIDLEDERDAVIEGEVAV